MEAFFSSDIFSNYYHYVDFNYQRWYYEINHTKLKEVLMWKLESLQHAKILSLNTA